MSATDEANRLDFLFPRTVFVDVGTLKGQIEKVESEVFEIHQLLGKKDLKTNRIADKSLNRIAEELEDAIQALETMRRILLERYNVNVYMARVQVIRKNRKKKYYGDREVENE